MMSRLIKVVAYSGYKTNERPRSFWIGQDWFDITVVEDRWHEPDGEYFKVRTTRLKTYWLRHDPRSDVWTLQSGYDGDDLLPRPRIELVDVGADWVRAAEGKIERCEHCQPTHAEVPLDWILSEVMMKGGRVEFMMMDMARCPNCRHALTEKSLVEPK